MKQHSTLIILQGYVITILFDKDILWSIVFKELLGIGSFLVTTVVQRITTLLDKLAGVIGILIKFLSLFGSNTHKSCIHGWSCYFAITAIFCSRSRIEHSAAH